MDHGTGSGSSGIGTRPPFDQALAYWRRLLDARRLPPSVCWGFREHLCLHYPVEGGGFTASVQTIEPSVVEEDARLVYDAAVARSLPIVFAVVASATAYTLCTLLGDTWAADDDVYVADWNLYFYRDGLCRAVEELTDLREWRRRKRRESRALSGLDYVYVLSAFKGRPRQDRLP